MKTSFLAAGLAVVLGSSVANAGVYTFEDKIDYWNVGGLTVGSAPILAGEAFNYTHDINDVVNFAAGDTVVEAFLELDFTNDETDAHGSKLWGLIKWDFREFVKVAFDGSDWREVGEVDPSQYELVLDIDWLNDNGQLDVSIFTYNSIGTAVAWLDHSILYGTATTAPTSPNEPLPVPEPSTLALFGLGLMGLGASRMRRKSA